MKRTWESLTIPMVLVILVLLALQFGMSPTPSEPGKVYLFTQPSGATISIPEAQSVHGFQVKPIAKSPGPLPLNLKESSRFTFVIDLPGYQTETLNLTEADFKSDRASVRLKPKVAILVPALYLIRDYPWAFGACVLLVGFGLLFVRPQILEQRQQRKLLSQGKLVPGMVLHKYRLVSQIGEGGAGSVFLAHKVDDSRGEKFAVKILHSADNKAELEQEIKACQKLSHRGIVHLFDWGELEGYTYLVFEFIEGRTLRAIKSPSYVEICRWCEQLVSALEYAHGQGLVHRDIKPDNIILDGRHEVHLLDFGLSASTDTQIEGASGTIGFMAPEQATGEVSKACDYYSLGVTLYVLLTGQKPFEGEEFFEVLAAQSVGRYQSLREHCLDVPPSLDRLVSLLLVADPKERLTDPGVIRDHVMAASAFLNPAAD